MRLFLKLGLTFASIAIFLVITSAISLNISEQSLQHSMGQSSILVANQVMDEIDLELSFRTEQFEILANDKEIKEFLILSNKQFESLDDPEKYIQENDMLWINSQKEEITPFMNEIFQNQISIKLKEQTLFFEEKYDYPLVGEIFVTNTYGANIAQTGKTSDYKQNDETWWQEARDKQMHISDVEYDESAQIYSTDISIRIDDDNGNFIGVMKVVLNIDEVIEIIKNAESTISEENITFTLLDSKNKVIYSTSLFDNNQDLTSNPYLQNFVDNRGYFLLEQMDGSNKKLVAYASSSGHSTFEGLGWSLGMEHDSDQILAPVNQMREMLYGIAAITGIFSSIVLGFIIFKTIILPIKKLQNAASEITQGNFDVKTLIHSKDEVGELSHQFDLMREHIKGTTNEYTGTIESRTKQLQEIKNALDQSTIVAITDKNGTINYVNEKFCEISKYSKDELIGKNHRILKSGYHNREFYQNMWNTINSGKVWNGDVKNKSKDGNFYWVRTTIVPFLDDNGNPEQFVAIRTDITEQKNNEIELKNAFDLLQKSQKIIKGNMEQLKQIDKQKEEFTAMISHELKTPLTPITLWCDALLEKDLLGELNQEQKDAIAKIASNSKSLQGLINDIFDAQKLDMKKLVINSEEIVLEDLMNEIHTNNSNLAKEKGITLINSTEVHITLKNDRKRLSQILNNLIKNALDFVPQNTGRIEINAKETDESITFFVKDNGVGIDKEQQPNLFKKFYQVDTSFTREHGGSGLGLAICKSLVDAMGGNIWVDSEKGRGATFSFKIPKEIELITQTKK